jgi:hypothetical protein
MNSPSSKWPISRSMARRDAVRGMPNMSAMKQRNSRPVSLSYRQGSSGT